MPKSKNHNRRQHNNSKSNTSAGSRPQVYASNARFVEMGAAGVPFRNLINIDHVVAVRFDEAFREGPDESGMVSREQTGWAVTIALINQANTINFTTLEAAIDCYNDILAQIATMAPCTMQPPLEMPEPAANEEDLEPVKIDNLDEFELSADEKEQLENPEFAAVDEAMSEGDDPDAEPAVEEKPVYPH